jgi:hypothetical protein
MASSPIRFATFNASLNRNSTGQLITDLSTPNNTQAQAVAEIIQRTNPDVLLINEFDYDAAGQAAALFRDNYLAVGQNGIAPVDYPYIYAAASNTGIPSGFDLDNNGSVGGPNDAQGFGFFPGQFGLWCTPSTQFWKIRFAPSRNFCGRTCPVPACLKILSMWMAMAIPAVGLLLRN